MEWRTHADKFGGSSWAKRCDMHKNHEVWSAWEKWRVRCIFLQRTLRFSNFAKHLPNSNALIAIYDGRSALSTVLVEDALKHRKELRMSTRATTTSYPFLASLSKRITSAVPDMDLLSDNGCFTRQKKCRKKAHQEKHGSHSSILARWHTDSEYRKFLSLIGWTEEHIMLYDRIALGKSFVRRNKSWENSKFRTLDSRIESGWCSTTVKSTTRLSSREKRMQEITRRTYGKDSTGKKDHSS